MIVQLRKLSKFANRHTWFRLDGYSVWLGLTGKIIVGWEIGHLFPSRHLLTSTAECSELPFNNNINQHH